MTQKIAGVITATSPAAASSVASTSVISGLDKFDALRIKWNSLGATGGTLDLRIQVSFDQVVWDEWLAFNQISAGAAAAVQQVSIPQAGATAPTVTGTGTTPVIAAGTVIGGAWAPHMRVLFTAGAGTSAGAAQTITVYGHRSPA